MGRWKPTCHTIELKRDSLNIHVSCAIWSTQVFISSFLQNTLSKVILFLDILMEWFFLRMQKVSNIPFPWGWGSASLPLCSSEVPSIYIARYGLDSVQDWPASGIVASRSPRRCDFLWECVKFHGCCTASSLQPGGQTASAMGVRTWCVTKDSNEMGHSNDVCLETKKVYTEHL